MAKKITGYLLTKEVASMFGVELRSVYRWIEEGKLHPQKIGWTYLFDPAEVARFKTERRNDTRVQGWEKRKNQ